MGIKGRTSAVKLLDLENNVIGKGTLLSDDGEGIKIAGKNLPELESGTKVLLEVYDDMVGVMPYKCTISIASYKEVNLIIDETLEPIERRTALKVKTDLTYNANKIFRNDENILDEVGKVRIYIHNLSQGGMLMSANFDFQVGDKLNFYFVHTNSKPILLEAKIIRADKQVDEDNDDLIHSFYGCQFINITSEQQSIIMKYLFERQIQLYREQK